MAALVFAVNPIIQDGGRIAAIILCLFIFIFVLLALVFNLAMTFGAGWLRDKVNMIKLLRPYVENVNKVSEAAARGVEPAADESRVAKTFAMLPLKSNAVDQKVTQTSDRVSNAIIEFRARSEQAKMVAKSFFLPGLTHRKPESHVDQNGLEFKSPGYRAMMEEELKQSSTEKEPKATQNITAD
ncbi:MAG TPA: hypothetical protein VL461_07670 [Dictyobacter sp.]|jgi:hypothetical protein|nr:hypothetical protein [Dictyobacter sp.]